MYSVQHKLPTPSRLARRWLMLIANVHLCLPATYWIQFKGLKNIMYCMSILFWRVPWLSTFPQVKFWGNQRLSEDNTNAKMLMLSLPAWPPPASMSPAWFVQGHISPNKCCSRCGDRVSEASPWCNLRAFPLCWLPHLWEENPDYCNYFFECCNV